MHPTLIMENENQDLMDRYLSTIHELNHEKIRREGFEHELKIQKGIVDSFAGNLIRIGNECRDHALEVKRLKSDVERLTKAGDAMALNLTHIGWNICVEAWNAAKGVQS